MSAMRRDGGARHTNADARGRNAYYRRSSRPEGPHPMPRHASSGCSRLPTVGVRAGGWLLLAALAGACGKSAASPSSPDFVGTWDLTFDDALDFELRGAGEHQRGQLTEHGGSIALRDAGVGAELDIDCTRADLVCPLEVWPHELELGQAPGRLDEEGLQLERAIAGEGRGRCATQPGSRIVGEVVSVAKPSSVRQEAVALTSGRIIAVYDAGCFAPQAGLPSGAQIVLSTGFTAAKR
jgi:hypothetical protein